MTVLGRPGDVTAKKVTGVLLNRSLFEGKTIGLVAALYRHSSSMAAIELRIQLVNATHWLNRSAGVLNSSFFAGRSLSCQATNPNVEPGEIDTARSHLHTLLGQVTFKPKDGVLWARPALNAKGLSEVRPLDGLSINSPELVAGV